MTVFFNTEIKSGSFLENVGNFCFLPIRELTGGKTYTYADRVFLLKESDIDSHIILKIIKVALALFFLIPGLILGTIFKSLSYIHGSVRQASSDFKAIVKPEFDKVLVEEAGGRVHLYRDPKEELNFSVPTWQDGFPFTWLQNNAAAPRKIDLNGMEAPWFAERLFKTPIDFSTVDELDIRGTRLVDKQILEIVRRCPFLRVLRADKVSSKTRDYIVSHCQTLDADSKRALGVVDIS